jgi:hypothetical protein
MVLRLGNFKMPAIAMETTKTLFNTKVNSNHIFSDKNFWKVSSNSKHHSKPTMNIFI